MGKRVFINLKTIYDDASIFKIVLSDRSDGKTTALELRGLDNFEETRKAAVFCRRFSTEFSNEFFDTFIQNIKNARPDFLENRRFDVIKPSAKRCGAFLLSPNDSDVKRTAFSFVPITKAGRLKSALGYETHKDVFFDEYIPIDGRYTKEEIPAILELYRTIDREHYDNKIMLCGNKITRFNPAFDFFNIRQWKKGINSYQNGALSLLVCSLSTNAQNAQKSLFGALVKDTAYEQYNAGEFLLTYDALTMEKHSKLLFFRIAHGGRVYGLYAAGAAAVIDYIHDGAPPSITVCVEAQPKEICALWLDVAQTSRKLLERFKYNNALFFANDAIANNLKKFYNAI